MTGSPLKDDFHVEVVNMSIETKTETYKIWSDAEECYAGTNVNIARSIVSELAEVDGNVPAMWILCDGLDAEKTLLVENEMDDTWWTRGVVQLRKPIAIEAVAMDQLIPIHSKSIPGRRRLFYSFDFVS